MIHPITTPRLPLPTRRDGETIELEPSQLFSPSSPVLATQNAQITVSPLFPIQQATAGDTRLFSGSPLTRDPHFREVLSEGGSSRDGEVADSIHVTPPDTPTFSELPMSISHESLLLGEDIE